MNCTERCAAAGQNSAIIALADTSSVGFYTVLSFNACYYYFFLCVLLHPYNNTHSESVHTGVVLGCSQLG